ncbi:Mandelate racemase/muconate lactonizing protein [Serratia proteamaculans]|uniref:mandelate racemase/muconate lactonizing enzyme family protein n=1 Tax=Serratia proteamaculans TaxID=28151 RepID=UPI0009F7B858|nr:mandelate racemase/muconate lactonizing enzyme family protein [Serratia proteamaculans]SMB54297.1 Mandelate racemase/muconate lactonizing protein [Serratia proteamaculans]
MDKIKQVNLYRAVSPLSRPIADSTHYINEISFVVAEVVLASGITGEGYLLSFHYSPEAIAGAMKDLQQFAVGYHCWQTGKFLQEVAAEHEYFGQNGLQKWAAATLNVAMWDAWGKTLQQPIWKMLGNTVDRVPVYGSGGWLSYSEAELLEEVLEYQARGLQAVKIKVGSPEVEQDIMRLRKVREAVGSGMKIMMDANQGMTLPDALKLSTQAADIGIHWFEEPLVHTDFDGYQQLRQKTGIALAMGEREYDMEPLKALITRNALDLWQPDLIRIGGVEPWRESAMLAHAHHLPVLPHYYKDYDVPLLCTIPNPYGAESFDWIDSIIDNPMAIDGGYAFPRSGAGWGFNFNPASLTEIK